MTPELWQSIMTAAVALGGRELVVGGWKWFTGRAGRERDRLRELLADRDKAEDERDHALAERDAEATFRRALEEHVGWLRLRLIGAGVPMHMIPPTPTRGAADRS